MTFKIKDLALSDLEKRRVGGVLSHIATYPLATDSNIRRRAFNKSKALLVLRVKKYKRRNSPDASFYEKCIKEIERCA